MDDKNALFFNILKTAQTELTSGHDLVIALITHKSGSSPRQRGAAMVVTEKGLVCGTIGGGRIEFLSIERAKQCIAEKNGAQELYNLTLSEASNTGMACGGANTVLFTLIKSTDTESLKIIERALECYGDSSTALIFGADHYEGLSLLEKDRVHGRLAKILTADECGRLIEKAHDRSYLKTLSIKRSDAADLNLVMVSLLDSPRVLIFGGGHVSQALTVALAPLDFEMYIFEDRDEFLQQELFAPHTHCVRIDFEHILDTVTPTENDYICIITRGHAYDFKTAEQLLLKPHAFIGSIGSKHKAKSMNEYLLSQGMTENDLMQLHCPIGLPVGNDTPAEIAISIAAQIIQVKSEKIR